MSLLFSVLISIFFGVQNDWPVYFENDQIKIVLFNPQERKIKTLAWYEKKKRSVPIDLFKYFLIHIYTVN